MFFLPIVIMPTKPVPKRNIVVGLIISALKTNGTANALVATKVNRLANITINFIILYLILVVHQCSCFGTCYVDYAKNMQNDNINR